MVSPLGAPPVWMENGSCHHPLLESDAEYLLNNVVTFTEIIKSSILFITSLLIIITNLFFIFSLTVVNFTKMLPRPTLYLLVSLSVCQLMTGLGVTAWGVYPSLTECWPFGLMACKVMVSSILTLCYTYDVVRFKQ